MSIQNEHTSKAIEDTDDRLIPFTGRLLSRGVVLSHPRICIGMGLI